MVRLARCASRNPSAAACALAYRPITALTFAKPISAKSTYAKTMLAQTMFAEQPFAEPIFAQRGVGPYGQLPG